MRTNKTRRVFGVLLWASAITTAVGEESLGGASKPDDATKPPPISDFLIIPLRVHILQAPEVPEIHCKLADEDVRRIVSKVNGIWHKAGVHWGLESIVREPATAPDKYKLALALPGGAPLGLLRGLIPEKSREFDGLHVYYVHELGVNGVYLGNRVAFVKETARLRPVEGGIDEPIPRVTAHELGHSLNLPHRQDRTNLLASGTTGTLLNTAEVERSRNRAKEIKGSLSFNKLEEELKKAEKQARLDRAKTLQLWRDEIVKKPEPST